MATHISREAPLTTPPASTTLLAIVSLVAGIVSWIALPFAFAPLAIITGHAARRRHPGTRGRRAAARLAAVGLAFGYSHFLWICIGVVSLLGEVTTLTCARAETGGPVDCILQRSILGLIPSSETELNDLREARVSETVDQDGDLLHRVELITPQGTVPLTSQYRPGSGSSQSDAAASINEFLGATSKGPLILSENLFSGLPTPVP